MRCGAEAWRWSGREAWREAWRTGPQTLGVRVTPNLPVGEFRARVGEFRARVGQRVLSSTRGRMRGAKDPPTPLDYVLQDSLGFEQVVACVVSSRQRRIGIDSNAGRHGRALGRSRGQLLGSG